MQDPSAPAPRAVVLGGYGLIGAAAMRALRDGGFRVTGVGRSPAEARRAAPWAEWIALDLSAATPAELRAALEGAAAVVNAAGALQDGPRDDLRAIHVTAMQRLAEALRGTQTRIVQVSAAGAAPGADTAFFRTKAEGDAILRAAGLPVVVLRPALVLAPQAHGGTALLRAAAALPLAEPRMFARACIQTVHVDDLAAAILAAARGDVPAGLTADLAEDGSHSFPEVLRATRRWLGLPDWRRVVPVSAPLLALSGRAADLAGRLGWRSPMRSTALRVLAAGVTADTGPWRAAGGPPCRPLDATLDALPSTHQERLFARSYLLVPAALLVLSLFWLASGVIGLWQTGPAMALLTERGAPEPLAALAVIGGGIGDIALGALVLVRRTARLALLGMIALTAAYLLGGALAAPDLWADPLGPMLKPIPAAMLAALLLAMLDER